MLNEFLTGIIATILEIILSIQFGAILITLGSIIYAPTGNRLGKYCILFGLLIFTIKNLMFESGY